jgi:hypothetical protein
LPSTSDPQELSLESLKQLNTLPSLLPIQAYNQLKEQILCMSKIPSYLSLCVETINNTSLDCFEYHQKVKRFPVLFNFVILLDDFVCLHLVLL